jgi:hypothetical protein
VVQSMISLPESHEPCPPPQHEAVSAASGRSFPNRSWSLILPFPKSGHRENKGRVAVSRAHLY